MKTVQRLDINEIMIAANAKYNEAKRLKTKYTGPRDFEIESEQVKAIAESIVEAVNEFLSV